MLKDKKVVITGATRGIGLATAELFARNGATLFLLGRDLPALQDICGILTEKYRVSCSPFTCDVSQSDEVKDTFKKLFKQTKTLDVLVNNAGVLDDALLGMVSKTKIEQTFATNTYSVLYTSQYAARMMQRTGGGSIINLASIIGVVGNSGQAVYGGSKAAVIGMTKSLAKELAVHNIRVNAIAPGFIQTSMTEQLPKDIFQQRIDSIALGRIGKSVDVANTALYLASELSEYVTGQVIGVDGGMLI